MTSRMVTQLLQLQFQALPNARRVKHHLVYGFCLHWNNDTEISVMCLHFLIRSSFREKRGKQSKIESMGSHG